MLLQATNAWLPLVRVGPAIPIEYDFVPARGMVANDWYLGASSWDNTWDSLDGEEEEWCPRTPPAVEGAAARCGSDCSWSEESVWEGFDAEEEEVVDCVRAYEVQVCCSSFAVHEYLVCFECLHEWSDIRSDACVQFSRPEMSRTSCDCMCSSFFSFFPPQLTLNHLCHMHV